MSHPWFESINWQDMFKKKMKAPYKPMLEHDGDVKHFATGFTEIDIHGSQSPGQGSDLVGSSTSNGKWDGISYNGSELSGAAHMDEEEEDVYMN